MMNRTLSLKLLCLVWFLHSNVCTSVILEWFSLDLLDLCLSTPGRAYRPLTVSFHSLLFWASWLKVCQRCPNFLNSLLPFAQNARCFLAFLFSSFPVACLVMFSWSFLNVCPIKCLFLCLAGLLVTFCLVESIKSWLRIVLFHQILKILWKHLYFSAAFCCHFPCYCSIQNTDLTLELQILILVFVVIILEFQTFRILDAVLAFHVLLLISCSVPPVASTTLPRNENDVTSSISPLFS